MAGMDGVTVQVKGNKMFITVDVSPEKLKEAPLSSTGRSRVVASTGGKFRRASDKLQYNLIVITDKGNDP